MDIKTVLSDAIKGYKISLSGAQYSQLEKYYELLCDWNKKMNLTAITDVQGVAVKHFADSLSLLNFADIKEGARIIDVGTGAGFPGVVLKIARPDINLTLLDSLNKRLVFLSEVLSALGLNAELVHSRAEDGAKKGELRESFDLAVSRAVARLNVLGEYCLPYVKPGGKFTAMKGGGADEEISQAKNAILTLGGKIGEINKFSLPYGEGERTIVLIDKVKHTPKEFPRNAGKIKSNPL